MGTPAGRTECSGEIVAVAPPFFGDGVRYGIGVQNGRDNEQVRMVTGDDVTLAFSFAVATSQDGLDFFGPYVHGRKGDRFLYVVWGAWNDSEVFEMLARTKLKFDDLSPETLDSVLANPTDMKLQCRFEATNHKGEPASGSVRPPLTHWSALKG